MRVALDLETTCAITGCKGTCDHALSEHSNRITVIGVYYERAGSPSAHTFRNLDDFRAFVHAHPNAQYVGHNLKWDLRQVFFHAPDVAAQLIERWDDDTASMAYVLTDKIPEDWLASYEEERKRRNALLPRGYSHREGSKHTLKTLAPFWLGVEWFWEDPTNHDNDRYVLLDCLYTHDLAAVLEAELKREGSYDFYKTKLLPWTKMLLSAEVRGITLDMDAMAEAEVAAAEQARTSKAVLDGFWAPHYVAYEEKKKESLKAEYATMASAAIEKAKAKAAQAKKPKAVDEARVAARYEKLFQDKSAKIEPFNLDSPPQLAWLLRERCGYDIRNFEGKESTGKVVLKGLAAKGHEDVKALLSYRGAQKLVSAFFPSYREMQHKGLLHTTFHIITAKQEHAGSDDDENGTRTGRLSSSNPNLQQVPGHLHKLFRARPGYILSTKDESAIEPNLIGYVTSDPNLCQILISGQDFHGHTTRVLFESDWDVAAIKKEHPHERNMGKRVGLQLFYGSGATGLQRTAQEFGYIWSKKECQKKLEAFKEFYAGVYAYRDELNRALLYGPVTTLFGRKYRIEDPNDIHMKGLNTFIQASASDLVLNSAHRINMEFQKQGIDGQVLLLVHDEIVAEYRAEHREEAERIMEHAMTDYDLPTPWGAIKLKVEGKTGAFWEK